MKERKKITRSISFPNILKMLTLILFLSPILFMSCEEKTDLTDSGDIPIEDNGDTLIHGGIASTAPYITGTFIDFWGKHSWSSAKWDSHMQEMKEIGIRILFVQFSAYNNIIWVNSPNDYSTEIYENALNELLASAERNEIQVFVGLYFNENYWSNASNPEEMNIHAQRSKNLADDIWKQVKYNKSFAGWYISQEGAPYYYDTESKFNVYQRNLINPIASHCKSISDKPVTTTVFFNYNLSTTDDFRLFMKRVSKCNLDAVLLQDGIGVAHCDLENLEGYFKAANDGLFTDGGYNGAFWADMETFTPEGNPESFSVIEQKLTTISKKVGRIITFQYYSDMSPTGPNGAAAGVLRSDYLKYLN